jgi:hypothetical protein
MNIGGKQRKFPARRVQIYVPPRAKMVPGLS